ncbi:MAG: hypothetical protein IT443_09190 [Phycisphaeraceae bacterium]|nr:hypothetical protein [Phycisphaeraceae bacterium]
MSLQRTLTVGLVLFCTISLSATPALGASGKSSQPAPTATVTHRPVPADAAVTTPPPMVPSASPDDVAVNVFDDRNSGAEETPAVSVSPFGQIDLHVKDVDLSKVLQMLSIQAQRNIVASRNVAGKVTADLYGVDFYDGLDAILHPNGFGYQEKGNFIYVYTQQELAAIQDAERELTTKVTRLSYITAVDASTFVSPLLSQAGSIAVSGAAAAGFEASSGDGGANSFAHADTLVIRDYPENVDQILAVLKELDIRPKQIMVEATVLEAKLTELNALGVDLTVMADFKAADFADPLNVVDELISGAVGGNGGAGSTNVGDSDSGKSGIKVGIVNDDFSVFIQALDQVTDATVLANPKLLVLNRQRAKLLVGERLGYVSTTQNENTTTQTVEFLDVGTSLSVRPFVGDDDFIRMEIKPAISTGNIDDVAGFVIPTQTTEELTTNVMVRSGQTVVLGGLFKESTTVIRKQVPFLGDVPILGAAFRGQDDNNVRNEYIFLVTPTIVKDQALYAGGDRAKQSVDLAVLGARENLLPWSRSKMQAGHIRDAMKYMDEGNRQRAMWSVDMALSLDPNSFEAQRLKAELGGSRKFNENPSILEDAASKMIDSSLQQPAQADTVIEVPTETPAVTEPTSSAAPAVESEPATAEADAQTMSVIPAVQMEESATEWTDQDSPGVTSEPAAMEAQPEVTVEEVTVEAAPATPEVETPTTAPSDLLAEPQSQAPATQPSGAQLSLLTPQASEVEPSVNVLSALNSWVPSSAAADEDQTLDVTTLNLGSAEGVHPVE